MEPENSKPDDSKAVRLQDSLISITSAQPVAPTKKSFERPSASALDWFARSGTASPRLADCATSADVTPSVSDFYTNEPGLNESKPFLRGFSASH